MRRRINFTFLIYSDYIETIFTKTEAYQMYINVYKNLTSKRFKHWRKLEYVKL